MLNQIDTDKWIANVLDNINLLRNKKNILLIFVTPFHMAALIGQLRLGQKLLGQLFPYDKWNKFASYCISNLVLRC